MVIAVIVATNSGTFEERCVPDDTFCVIGLTGHSQKHLAGLSHTGLETNGQLPDNHQLLWKNTVWQVVEGDYLIGQQEGATPKKRPCDCFEC